MGELDGRVIAVAGVGGGLGPAVVERFAAEGATLALADIAVDRIETAVEPFGIPADRLDMQAVDLLDVEAAAAWCASLEERFGRVDGLLHLVGGWRGGDPIESFDLADYDWLHDLLVRTLQNATRAFHGALTAGEHGRFAIVSSAQAQAPEGTNAAYAATKAAAESWTLALADSFAGSKATANVVVVNAILTRGMRERNPDKEYPSFTPAEEIADALLYLCSDAAGRMNGQRLELHPVSLADPRGFASDNHSGAHPEVLEAVARANVDHAGSYGDDAWTRRFDDLIRDHFGPAALGFPVFNGTAANVLAIDAVTRPHEAVVCVEGSHIDIDECGAPERWAGVKLLKAVPAGGKLEPGAMRAWEARRGDQHHNQPRLVSVAESTEVGTLYTLDELRTLADEAHGMGMLMHVDGARLANAAAALGVPLGTLAVGVEADVVSLGATKNGGLVGDAVVFLDPGLARNFEFVRKQGMQLASKMRFLSAQFDALFGESELWRRNAESANAMAARLGAGVTDIDGIELIHPVQANGVFAKLPRPAIDALLRDLPGEHPFYVWDEDADVVRWMCSWDTTESDVDALIAAVRAALA